MSASTTGDARGLRLPNDGPTPGPESNQPERNTEMTTETTEPVTTEPESIDTTTTEPESTETGSAAEKRYRLQLREAEAERDGLRTVVESMRRQDAERLTEGRLVSSQLLWTVGDPADVLTEDGHGVDPDKVAALCDAVVAKYGDGVKNTRRPGGVYAPLEGRTMRGRPQAPSKGMEGAFSPEGWGESDD
jgi:hypothetical protein